jgi:hypothetical protein
VPCYFMSWPLPLNYANNLPKGDLLGRPGFSFRGWGGVLKGEAALLASKRTEGFDGAPLQAGGITFSLAPLTSEGAYY